MRLLLHPDRKDISLVGVLYALGDPVRLEIVRLLAVQEELSCSACDDVVREIVAEGIAKSTLSYHFRILRESGVLFTRKEGTTHINSLRRQDLESLFPGLLKVILQPIAASESAPPRSQ